MNGLMGRPSVLIVDGDLEFVVLLGPTLNREGFGVCSADDQADALEQSDQEDAHVVWWSLATSAPGMTRCPSGRWNAAPGQGSSCLIKPFGYRDPGHRRL
jgi:hypothetical protein